MSVAATTTGEKKIGMAEAAALVAPARGATKTATQTLVRWARKGVLVGTVRVRLDAVKRGGVWLTTAGAVQRFLDATNAGAAPEPVVARTPTRSRRDSVEGGRKLQKLGL